MFGSNRRHVTNEGGTEVVLGGAINGEDGERLHALLHSLLVDKLAAFECFQTHYDSFNVSTLNGWTTHIMKRIDVDLQSRSDAMMKEEEEKYVERKESNSFFLSS